jgi:hypothetical protein
MDYIAVTIMPELPSRRFPPPWSVDELEACFVVKDESGQKLAYVYFEHEAGRRAKDEARPVYVRPRLALITAP